jgi:DNA polymerase-3 subunit delta'
MPGATVTPVPLFGHERLRARLASSADAGRLPSAMAFIGPRGIGKQRLALWLGQRLLCTAPAGKPCGKCQACGWAEALTHPDLTWVFPRPRLKDSDATADMVWDDLSSAIAERRDAGWLYAPASGSDAIYVSTVRALLGRMALTPALGSRKVFVIGDAERMVPQEGAEAAANAFLKALEEPPSDTTIILTTSAPDALLPTIRSRVVSIRVSPVNDSALRAFVAHETVQPRLATGANGDALVRTAAGAPGALLATRDRRASAEGARALLDATKHELYRVALRQGAAGARGAFAERLDALTVGLYARARDAITRGDTERAQRAIDGVTRVERAKEMLENNVNPQLITAVLLMGLRP